MDETDALAEDLDKLTDSFAEARGLAGQFEAELSRVSRGLGVAGVGLDRLERGLTRGLDRAVDGMVLDGDRLSDALRNVTRSVVDAAYRSAVRPVTRSLSSAVMEGASQLFGAAMPFANGGAFSQGRVRPFASGGVVSGPVGFPMRGGMGVMGEAGPEAIMPLSRGSDGKLGVRVQGAAAAAPVTVVMNISTPDVAGFERSRSQIAARMQAALATGQKNR